MSQSPPLRASTWPATHRPAHDPSDSSNTASPALDVAFQSTQSPPNGFRIPSSESPPLERPPHPTVNAVTVDIVAAWKAQLAKLSAPEREMFERHGARDFTQYVNHVETLFESQSQKSRAVKVARLFKPLFDTMNLYAPVARTMVQADPTSSALVLGGITCVMSISQRFLGFHEKITDMLGEMGKKVGILLTYGSEIYNDNTEVLSAIVIVFGDILEFCSTAWHMFRRENGEPRSSAKTFFTSLGKSYETKFGEIISKLERDLNYFDELALQSDRRDARSDRRDDRRFQTESRGFYAEIRDHIYSQVSAVPGLSGNIASIGRPLLAANSQRRIQELQSRETASMESLQELKAHKEQLFKEMNEKRGKIIQWLPSTEYHEDQDKRFTSCLEGTGEWLLKDPNYQEWKSSKSSQVLWVHGKNGCGKSHVASQVIQDLDGLIDNTQTSETARSPTTALAYIFCNLLYIKNIDPAKLLGSLLRQLCHMLPRPEINSALETLYDKHAEVRKLKVKEIQDAIQSILGKFTQTYIVVDGLDECHLLGDEKFKSICDFLASLAIPRPDVSVVKVLAFSRPGYSQIQSTFATSSRIVMDSGANSSDIMKFIADKLSSFSFLQNDTPLFEEIRQKLLARADGMFLYISLTINMLAKARSPNDLRKKIQELPHTLGQVYQRSMSDIIAKEDTKEEALRILLWLTNASRPLRREELLEALSIKRGIEGLEEGDRLFDDRFFISACADLITLDKNQSYQLIHSSLSEYLSETASVETQIPPEYFRIQCVAHRILAETCLTYLHFRRFDRSAASRATLTELLRVNPFLAYAAENWGRHVRLAEDQTEDLKGLTMTYLSSAARRELSLQILMRTETFPFRGITSQLHILAIFNLVDVASSMRNTKILKLERDGLGYLPLDYALRFRSREICNWLLQDLDENGVKISSVLETRFPMHIAAINDWSETVESLIAWRCDIELKDSERKRTPLHVAVLHGSEHAFEALIKAKADIDARDEKGSTPLILAIAGRQLKICKALLGCGANINIEVDDHLQALHFACLRGNRQSTHLLLKNPHNKEYGAEFDPAKAMEGAQLEMLELLLAKGANIEARGLHDFRALHMACFEGHLRCSLRLIEHGANINALTNDNNSILHVAATNGQLHLIRGLMETHRESLISMLNSQNKDGDTPLHKAAYEGHTETARFLLEQGADVDAIDNQGLSSLHRATLTGYIETARMLAMDFKANADLSDKYGFTPLDLSILKGYTKVANMLLDHAADLHRVTKNGKTALHYATSQENVVLVRRLLELKYDGLKPDDSQRTPFWIAMFAKNDEVVDAFLERGIWDWNTSDRENTTWLHVIASTGRIERLEKLAPYITPEILNARDNRGFDALTYAALSGRTQMMDALISLGLSSHSTRPLLPPRIVEVTLFGEADALKKLIAYGHDVNCVAKVSQTTPLHAASRQGFHMIIDTLLEARADVSCYDIYGLTPYDWAERHGFALQHKLRPTAKHLTLDFQSRGPLLQEALQKLTDGILALYENRDNSTAENQLIRSQYLYALSDALVEMNSITATNAAVVCCLELCYASNATPGPHWMCDICSTLQFPANRYTCRENLNIDLCQNCYEDYAGGEFPQAPSEDVIALQRLERKVQPLRKLVATYIRVSSVLIGAACRVVQLPRAWIEENLQDYDKWEVTTRSHLKNARRPGQQLLKLLQRAYEATDIKNYLGGDDDDYYSQLARTFDGLDNDFNEHFIKRPVNIETFYFNCTGHEFLQIPSKDNVTDEQKLCLDADFRVNKDWLSSLPKQLSQLSSNKTKKYEDSRMNEAHLAEMQVQQIPTTEEAPAPPTILIEGLGTLEAVPDSKEVNEGLIGMQDGKSESSAKFDHRDKGNPPEDLARAKRALVELKLLLSSLDESCQSSDSETDGTEAFFDAVEEISIFENFPWDLLPDKNKIQVVLMAKDIIQAMCLGYVETSLLDEFELDSATLGKKDKVEEEDEDRTAKESLAPSELS